MFICPDFLLVAFAVKGMVFCFLGAKKIAKRMISFVVLMITLITICPLGTILLVPLEHRFPTNPTLPEKVDGTVMLGGAENNQLTQMWHQPETNNAADRYIGSAHLARADPYAVHLYYRRIRKSHAPRMERCQYGSTNFYGYRPGPLKHCI